MKEAMNSLADMKYFMEMDQNDFYREEIIDIGDNCWMIVKMGDFSMSPESRSGQSGYETEWVKYGERNCWSEVTQIYGNYLTKISRSISTALFFNPKE